ncbi:MAG: MotA/TolQ/ExbB proton channel family protein, partial [Pirellulales bacterium]|nr:MotA/TolQ/ExbB proton channel family protein [Pirellulales bacterium]
MDLANWGVGQFVYRVSLLLLYPTLVLLSLGFLKTMWHLGELVHDTWLGRSRRNMQTGRQLRDLALGEGKSLARSLEALAESRRQHPQLRRFVQNLLEELDRGTRATLPARLDHLVAQVEAELARDVNRVRVLVRLGPLLGLAGTLIPLGPALMALSEGDLSSLSAQLVVAFSTTVVGLLVGG